MKLPIIAFLAVLVNALLFGIMQLMIAGEKVELNNLANAEIVDFIRNSQDNQPIQPRERKLPEPPPEKPPEPLPQTQVMAQTQTQAQPLPMPTPQLKLADMATGLDMGGPYLGPVMNDSSMMSGAQLFNADNLTPIFRRLPTYPKLLKRRRIEGSVRVEFTVNTQGFVESMVIIQSKPKGLFDKTVLDAIKTWRFQPQKRNGITVPIRVYQVVNFTIRD